MEKIILVLFIKTLIVHFTYCQISIDPFTIAPTKAGWETRYLNRVDELDNGYTWNNHSSDTDDGKRYWSPLLADMKNAEGNSSTLQSLIDGRGHDGIFSSYAGSFYKPFSCPGYCMYYFKYKNDLPSDQLTQVESKWNSSGRDYTSRPDHEMDPIYSCTEFNSENFNWMARLGGYLMAEEFNDQTLIDGIPAIEWYENYVRNWVRATYAAGRVEWNSHVYTGFCFQAALVLYEHAKDTEIRKMARAVLDWMVLENALHYLDGNLVGPDSRDKGNGYKDFEGSVNGWNFVHLADDDFFPHLSTDYIDKHFSGRWTIGFIKQSTYRPPQTIIDIAQRKFDLPIEMHNAKPFYWLDEENYKYWKGDVSQSRRFEFEFQYMDKNYLLASVASGRPSGDIGHFSEQCVWKLGVMGTDTSGAVVLYGNSDNRSSSAGRAEDEQIGQYRNVMMRVIKGTNNMWTSIPKDKPAEISGNKVFVDLGNDVYAALIPYNTTGVSSTTCSKDSEYERYNWSFSSSELGALVLEVGTKKNHGSYTNFKTEINNNTTLSSPGTDQVEYISTAGRSLKIQKMPNEPYPHYCGGSYSNGGTYPKVWTDGEFVDFSKWNVYEVVYGEKIVDQKWGMGQVNIESDSNDLTIMVDPSNGEATWWKKDPAAPEPPQVQSATICGADSTTIYASGAKGSSVYNWYESVDAATPITGEHDSSFTTPYLTQEKTYYVSIDSAGKESMKVPVTVYLSNMPENLIVPDDPGIPTESLKAYFPFNGDANDVSPNGYNADNVSATLETDRNGKENSCYSFNGSQYINYYSSNMSLGGTGNKSFSIWAKTDQFDGGGPFGVGYYYYGHRAIALRTDSSDHNWILDLGGEYEHKFSVSNTKGSWHHWVITYDGSNVKVFCDTIEALSVTASIDLYNYSTYVGRTTYYKEDFTGLADEFVIYEKALSLSEIKQLYLTKGMITGLWLEADNPSAGEMEVTLYNSQKGVFYWLEQYPEGSKLTNEIAGNDGDIIINATGLSDTNDIVIMAKTESGCEMMLDTILNSSGMYFEKREINIQNDKFSIYPNPTKGMVYFNEEANRVSLYNTIGVLVKEEKNVSSLNLKPMKPGLYILKADAELVKVLKR